MSNFNYFLKILKKEKYPNDSLHDLAKFASYDMFDFLMDMNEFLGDDEEKLMKFASRTFNSLYESEKGVKIFFGENSDYAYVKLIPKFSDLEENLIVIEILWTESQVSTYDGEGNFAGYKSFENLLKIGDETGDYDDFDFGRMNLSQAVSDFVWHWCGFIVTSS